MPFAITALLGWSACAFGAVYAWAYLPLAAGIVTVAALVLVPSRRRVSFGSPIAGSVAVIVTIAAQLVPVRAAALGLPNEGVRKVLSTMDVGYANGVVATHSLSVDAAATWFALAAFALLALWLISISVLFTDARKLYTTVRYLIVIGCMLGLVGVAQRATFNGKLLWFWTPAFYATNAFGPFVNRNHFAGWMLLTVTLAIGYLFGRLSQSTTAHGGALRDRLLWLGSRDAVTPLLVSAAVIVMLCAAVWTMSRSGIVATGVALTILFAAAIRRGKARIHRNVVAVYLLLVTGGVVAWRGTSTLAAWYADTSTLEWRIQLWQDTMPALRDFWLTGSGVNTYGTVMLVYPRTDLSVLPRQAHNDYLQLAVEGGLLVCVPATLLIIALGRLIIGRLRQPQNDMTWWIRMGASAGICGMAVQELTEFSLQIPAVALLFATCVAIAIHRPAETPVGRRRTPQAEALVTAL
jgi:O-antigen ligase